MGYNKEKLIKILLGVRKKVCGYVDEGRFGFDARCDCKYGGSMSGEQT